MNVNWRKDGKRRIRKNRIKVKSHQPNLWSALWIAFHHFLLFQFPFFFFWMMFYWSRTLFGNVWRLFNSIYIPEIHFFRKKKYIKEERSFRWWWLIIPLMKLIFILSSFLLTEKRYQLFNCNEAWANIMNIISRETKGK